MAKVVQVIETEITRGEGVTFDRCRKVMQYWSLDGQLLAEVDPCSPNYFTAFADGQFQDAGWMVDKNDHIQRRKP